VHELASRVSVQLADDIDALPAEQTFACRLTVRHTDGTVARLEAVDPPGGHKRPHTNKQNVDKSRRITNGLIDQRRQEELIDAVLCLPERTVTELVELLAPPTEVIV